MSARPSRFRRFRRLTRRPLRLLLRTRWWWLAALLVIAVQLRWQGMGKPVWQDEVQSLVSAQYVDLARSPQTLLIPTVSAAHAAMKLESFGRVEWVRFPYLLAGLGAIAFGWLFGRLWGNWLLAVILGLGLTFWPFKAYWDTMIRDYALLLLLAMGCLYAWERRRIDGRLASTVLALFLTMLVSLTHQSGWVMWTMAGYYLAWEGLGLAWLLLVWLGPPLRRRLARSIARLRNRPVPTDDDSRADIVADSEAPASFPARPGRRLPLGGLRLLAATGLACGFFTLAVTLNFGWPRAQSYADKAMATLATPTDPASEASPDTGRPARPAGRRLNNREPRMPNPALVWTFTRDSLWSSFVRERSPEPLLGLSSLVGRPGSRQNNIFQELFAGPIASRRSPPLSGSVPVWMLAGLALGSLLVLRRSPPLLLSLWTMVVLTSLIVKVNTHLRLPMPRYYTLVGLAWFVLLAVAASAVVGLLRLPLWRRRRLGAWATLAMGAALFVMLPRWSSSMARAAAGHSEEDWRSFYRAMRAAHPGGTLFAGFGAKLVDFERRLGVHRDRRENHDDPWTGPARDGVLDAYLTRTSLEKQIYDWINLYEGVAFFRPRSWPDSFDPLQSAGSIFHSRAYRDRTVLAVHYSTNNMLFVMRGCAALPILPRFRAPAPSGEISQARFECHFETPGEYELLVFGGGGAELTGARWDGAPLTLQSRATADETTATARSTAAALREVNRVWTPAGDARPSVVTTATTVQSATLRTRVESMQTHNLTLDFDRPLSDPFPSVIVRLMPQNWTRVSPSYEIGDLIAWEDDKAFYIGAPLRLTEVQTLNLVPRYWLVDGSNNQSLKMYAFELNQNLRGLGTGDIVWSGPVELKKDVLRQYVGKDLVLTLQPVLYDKTAKAGNIVESVPQPGNPHRFGPLVHYLVCRLRPVESPDGIKLSIGLVR